MSRILIQDGSATVLLEKLLLAETTTDRMRGLLGRASLPPDTGMLIRPCRSIHMWFMRFPIDVAFIDRDLCVLKRVSHVQPWRIVLAPPGTCCVLETAAGVLAPLKIGDRLTEE